MDGYHPNAFLAKKLMTEGLLDEDSEDLNTKSIKNPSIDEVDGNIDTEMHNEEIVERIEPEVKEAQTEVPEAKAVVDKEVQKKEDSKEATKVVKDSSKDIELKDSVPVCQKKRLSDTSEDSDTQVIIKKEGVKDKRKSTEMSSLKPDSPPVKKRKASPIVFDVDKKDTERTVRERTISAGSDSHVVTLSTVSNTHKYDSVPPCKIILPFYLILAIKYNVYQNKDIILVKFKSKVIYSFEY